MNLDSCIPPKIQEKTNSPFLEIWALIHSKGLLNKEVQEFYRKACLCYEKMIFNDHEEVELQEVENYLWKVHYKHIEEFRKRIRQSSTNNESTVNSHMEGFKSFLTEATEFYQNLISKLRESYGLREDPPFAEKGGGTCVGEPNNLHKCQYLRHRFLVCLGDLARYGELCKKIDLQKHNWSVAAAYYFQAAFVWPDSGNPQNQLALLARYIGDDFLALYHCIRSLAVKEPFPDAWRNLIILFEENRSSHLESLSREAHFDFLNPFQRSVPLTDVTPSGGSANNNKAQHFDRTSSLKNDMWPLFVRLIGLFFIESSLEEFPWTFASVMSELDILLELDDTKLNDELQSYQRMDLDRTGASRAVQLVSMLIFVIDSLTKRLEDEDSEERSNLKLPNLVKSALTATFIFIGRLTERCLTGSPVEHSPLLPAVLVFIEWLVGMLDNIEIYAFHVEVRSAISYFLGSSVELLNRIHKIQIKVEQQENIALWEDYELRGFEPISRSHESLDFRTHQEAMSELDGECAIRVYRICHAAMKIVEESDGSQNWISYENVERKFCKSEQREAEEAKPSPIHEAKEPTRREKENEKNTTENEKPPSENGKSVVIEEEEEILFKPIVRYNSAPIYSSSTDDEISSEDIKEKTVPSDDSLRRAASLFAAQNQNKADPFNFLSDSKNFKNNNSFKQHETLLKDTGSPTSYPAGPPSLNAWFLDKESSNTEKEKATREFFKPRLTPVDEMGSLSLTNLSITETQSSLMDSLPPPSPVYCAPVPSAPLLPDDSLWFSGTSTDFSDTKTSGILGASPMSSHTNWSPNNGPSSFSPLSSSEWLHQLRNRNLDMANNLVQPVHFYAPGNFYGHDGSRFDLCDRWGNPLSYNRMVFLESPQVYAGPQLGFGADELRREKLFHNYQRPSPFGCGGAMADITAEQPPLLQHLKEKEWQLQRQSQLGGRPYMGN